VELIPMIHTTPANPKFRQLKARLGLSHIETVGLLESLWHYTVTVAPLGDIGRKTNREIMDSMEWKGDPDEAVSALTELHWIDVHPDPSVRLVIHEWHLHCPEFLKRRVLRSRGETRFYSDYVVGQIPPWSDMEPHGRTNPAMVGHVSVNQTKPNLTKPNQSINTFPPPPDETPPEKASPRRKKAPKQTNEPKMSREDQKWFKDRWVEVYPGQVPEWERKAATWIQVHNLLKVQPLDEIKRRWQSFLADPFEGFKGHSLLAFATKHFDRYANRNSNGNGSKPDSEVPAWARKF